MLFMGGRRRTLCLGNHFKKSRDEKNHALETGYAW